MWGGLAQKGSYQGSGFSPAILYRSRPTRPKDATVTDAWGQCNLDVYLQGTKSVQLKLPNKIATLGLLLFFCASLVSCGSRPLTEKDVVGTYKAQADWGESTLVLRPDHTFEQTVQRNDHTHATTQGMWQLNLYDGKDTSYGIVAFKPFLAVAHDQKGEQVGGTVPSISRGLLWGIVIAADPDWGISFDKE